MKKGFTLVEVLGVIVIIGVIGIIVVPTVDKQIKKGREDTYQAQLASIINSAKNYTIDNPTELPTTTPTSLSLGTLIADGYVDENVKNPKTGEEFELTDYIEISLTTTTTGGNCSVSKPCTSYCYCMVVNGDRTNCTDRCE